MGGHYPRREKVSDASQTGGHACAKAFAAIMHTTQVFQGCGTPECGEPCRHSIRLRDRE